jgi:hypothetical protein
MNILSLLNPAPQQQPVPTHTGPVPQPADGAQRLTHPRSASPTGLQSNKRRKIDGPAPPRQSVSLVAGDSSTAVPSSWPGSVFPFGPASPTIVDFMETLRVDRLAHESEAFETNRGLMTQRLLSRHLHVVPNHGGQANNCLIISLLQHATRNYSSEHVNAAADVRRALAAAHPTVSLDEPLHSDDAAARWLIEHVVQNHARGRDMQVFFLEPGQDGQPIPRIGREGSGPAVGIANWGVHFEAVMNLSDTDLITHLVDMAPQSSRRQDDETMRSHAQRLMREDPLVLALPDEQKLGLVAKLSRVPLTQLRQDPLVVKPSDKVQQQAAELAERVPRGKIKRDMDYARHCYERDDTLRAMEPDQAVKVLSALTGIQVFVLAREPLLNPMPQDQVAMVEEIRRTLKQGRKEAGVAYAKRICEERPAIRALEQDVRIALLALVTGQRAAQLRDHPPLLDVPPHLRTIVDRLRATYVRVPGEQPMDLARRVMLSDHELQRMTEQADRIQVLGFVSGTRFGTLRHESVFNILTPELTAIVNDIRPRLPQRTQGRHVPAARLAHLVYQSEPQLQALPYKQRIAALSLLTGSTESNLRREAWLRDADPALKKAADALRREIPPGNTEGTFYARKLMRSSPMLREMDFKARMALLEYATGARASVLSREPELQNVPDDVQAAADALLQRMPMTPGEGPVMYARRALRDDVVLRTKPYDERIRLISVATLFTEAPLRQQFPPDD